MVLNVHRRRDWAKCMRARVWLNGEEVTSRCFYADGRRGVVRLHCHNASGRLYPDPTRPDRLATEERRGRVRLQVSR